MSPSIAERAATEPALEVTSPRRGALGSEGWEYVGVETDYLTHNLHRYSSKFIPQIARRSIEALSSVGDLVLDPFCGSGTTLLEAALAKRASCGIDINPLACLLSRAKTSPIALPLLREAIREHRAAVQDWVTQSRDGQFTLRGDPPPPFEHPYEKELRKWFQPQVLNELWLVQSAIKLIESDPVRDLCAISFSDTLRRVSNAHPGYANVMFDRNAPTKGRVMEAYLRRLEINQHAVEELSAHPEIVEYRPAVLIGEAAAIPLANSSVDLIVTHPPYIASVPYAEYLVLSLLWFAIDPRDLDGRLLGGRRARQDVAQRFLAGMEQSFAEMRRVLRDGAFAVVVIGNPVVRGAQVDLNGLFKEMAARCGFVLSESILRTKTNMRANKMREEFVLAFRRA